MTPDPAATSFLQYALSISGLGVTLQRVSGYAPNVTVQASASVKARILDLKADTTETAQTGLSASAMGVIEQADRTVIISAADLAASSYPLPVQRGDQIILPDNIEILNVLRVDAYSHRFSSGLVLTVVGVA